MTCSNTRRLLIFLVKAFRDDARPTFRGYSRQKSSNENPTGAEGEGERSFSSLDGTGRDGGSPVFEANDEAFA